MSTTLVSERLKAMPTKPGVYLMRDADGNVLYVGKAANLRSRVRSYFGSSYGLQPKIEKMVARVADIDFILANSEQEALILECNLIKRHRPYYNSRLKDDKSYPYMKIDLTEEFPRVYFTRRVEQDGARYFGPYASAGSLRTSMDLIKKLFPYRSCNRIISGVDPRACLDYYIHRCVGPCIGAASKEQYGEVINQVILFLEGRQEQVVKEVRRKMEEASTRLEFERAAVLRDQLLAIERTTAGQRVVSPRAMDRDVIALAIGKDEAWVEVFFIRRGKLIGRDNFMMEGTLDEEPSQIITSFVKQFYASASYIPQEVLLQHPVDDMAVIQGWLTLKRGRKVGLQVPQRGERYKLVAMVAENAQQGLEQMRVRWLADTSALAKAMAELQESLSLPRLPRRIECYDISNIQGSNPVGSMVVFEDGKPKPSHYRRFKIKSVTGIDDYAMMQEMLRRRFRRLSVLQATSDNGAEGERSAAVSALPKGERDSFATIPDLVLIDGGRGHLNAVLEVMLELGVRGVPLASIAKEEEVLFIPEMPEPVLLPRSSQGLFLIQRVRDEAHRFAITFHKSLRSKKGTHSAMDDIPGIGPKRKRALLRKFGSLQAIREAPVEELASVPGMTRTSAQKLKELL